MQFSSHFISATRLAIRSNFAWPASVALIFLLVAALIASMFSGRQPATVTLDVGLSVIRMILPFISALMVQELLSREFDRRYCLNTFSYPHTRNSFLLGRFLAVALLTIGFLLVLSSSLALLVWIVKHGYPQGTSVALGAPFVITIGFIGLDLLLLVAAAFLFAIITSTPYFVLIGTLGVMIIGRSFAAVIDLLTYNSTVVSHPEGYRASVSLLGYILPDLGALDVRMVALYGRMEFMPPDWPLLVVSTLAYTCGLLGLATWALQRKLFA